MRAMQEGDEIDLERPQLMAVEPVIRDLHHLVGLRHARARAVSGDGFAYSTTTLRTATAAWLPRKAVSLDLPDVSSTFADLALFWTKFADMNVYCDRLGTR